MEKQKYDLASGFLRDIHVADLNVKNTKQDLDAIKYCKGNFEFKIEKIIKFTRGGSYEVAHDLKLDIPTETVIKLLKSKLYVSENLLKKANLEFKNL